MKTSQIDSGRNVMRVTCSAFSKQVSNVKALYKDHDNSRLKAWMFAATIVAAKIGGFDG